MDTLLYKNIPKSIENKIGANLHLQKLNPIAITLKIISKYFSEYTLITDLSPKVSTYDNFDSLLIPKDHPARSLHDTYYYDKNTVLRTHTSAHQHSLLSSGLKNFLVAGDVYRKDEINRTHYPIFHQIEGVHCINKTENDSLDLSLDLKNTLEGLIKYLFPGKEYRWKDDYFPFTNPSYEIEVLFDTEWLEILGCGIIQPKILESAFSGKSSSEDNLNIVGWAFGIGLERIAMILFDIPDIRYFWSNDEKFLNQFKNIDTIDDVHKTKFKSYSNLNVISRDISFWIDETWNENDFMAIIRNVANDHISSVVLFDEFENKQKIKSKTYKISYEAIDSSIKNPAQFNNIINELHKLILNELSSLPIKIR